MYDFLKTAETMRMLDSVAPGAEKGPTTRLDGVDENLVTDSASDFASRDLSLRAAGTVQTWVETDDLDEGEGAADRLLSMLVAISDADDDAELSEDEQAMVSAAAEEAWAYMEAKGVSEADLDTLFNSEDAAAANAAGQRVIEFLAEALPDGDEAAADELDDFAFGSADQASVFDAVYKKKFVVKHGRKMRVNRRISGTVRRTAKQKVAIRKASRKSHGARAMMKRAKSLRVRKSLGL